MPLFLFENISAYPTLFSAALEFTKSQTLLLQQATPSLSTIIMSETYGTLDNFDNALEKIGFWGSSCLNPNNMKNNCVSVSVARLEFYRSVDDLWNDIYGSALPDSPLSFDEIIGLLRRTGFEYNWEKFSSLVTSQGTKTAFEMMEENFYNLGGLYTGGKISEDGINHWPDRLKRPQKGTGLICYIRNDKTGHCVNMTYTNQATYNERQKLYYVRHTAPMNYSFIDFQQDDKGIDCVQDIKRAEHICVLYSAAKQPGRHSKYVNLLGKRLERRQDLEEDNGMFGL